MIKPRLTPPSPLALYQDAEEVISKCTDQKVLVSYLRTNHLYEEAELADKPEQAYVPVNFNCPVTEVRLLVPCSLDECRYHLDYKWSNNCLLAYSQQQGADHLSPEEISYLYAVPVEKVNTSLDKTMATLRREFLVAEALNDIDLQPQFSFVATKKVCCVCGIRIESKKDRIDVRDLSLAYCSRECSEEKNAQVINLEFRLGLPIEFILQWAMKKFKTVSLAEKALGMPRWLLQELCQKFLDKELREFFPEVKETPSKHKILCHTPVDSKDKSGQKAMRVTEQCFIAIRKQHGDATISFTDLDKKLESILSH